MGGEPPSPLWDVGRGSPIGNHLMPPQELFVLSFCIKVACCVSPTLEKYTGYMVDGAAGLPSWYEKGEEPGMAQWTVLGLSGTFWVVLHTGSAMIPS